MDELELNSLYRSIIDNATVGIGLTDTQGRFILVNYAWCRKMGYNQVDAKYLTLADVTVPEDLDTSKKNFRKLVTGEVDSVEKLTRYMRKDGSSFWANLFVTAVKNKYGEVTSILGVFHDVELQMKDENSLYNINKTLEATNEKLAQANLEIQKKNEELQLAYNKLNETASKDALTGLHNRRQLEEQLLMESKRTMRSKREFSICIADIDDFKLINDNYGHDTGDIVLKDIGNIFLQNSRITDFIGRWGGEEFLFILPETPVSGAMLYMERIRQQIIEHKIQKDEKDFSVTITIGISSFQPGDNLDEIVKQADLALYAGKKSGKNIAVKYDKKLEIIHSIPSNKQS